jgi:hypothetical protein
MAILTANGARMGNSRKGKQAFNRRGTNFSGMLTR